MRREQMVHEKKREQLHEILDLVLDINHFEDENSIEDENPKAIFEFKGYCNVITVQVFAHGWESKKTPDIQYFLNSLDESLWGDKSLEEIIEVLKATKHILGLDAPAEQEE